MATTTVTGPDGKDYEVTHPDGAAEADIIAYAKTNYGGAAEHPSNPTGLFGAIKHAKAESERIIGETGARRSVVGPLITGMIPETPGQAVSTGIMAAAGPASLPLKAAGRALSPLARILAGTGAGAAGAAVDEGDIAEGAAKGGVVTGAIEGLIPTGGALLRWGTGAKARIAERMARGIRDFAEATVPELRSTIEAAKSRLSPLLRGGRTAAALEETALGEGGRKTLSNVMERGMYDATLAARGQGIRSTALDDALGVLQHHSSSDPLLRKNLPTLYPNPNGEYTISQAEELLARVGDMLKSNPISRTINDRDLTHLYGRMLNETVSGLPRQAAEVFATARDKFKGGTALFDMLRQPTARQGGPNRIALNEPALAKYLSENRAELRTKFGPAFDDLVSILTRGGQLGTRSISTPGTGETLSALRQVYGRGQGGAPQLFGSVARTALPNLGYQSTGQAPYTMPEGMKALLDILGIAATTGGR